MPIIKLSNFMKQFNTFVFFTIVLLAVFSSCDVDQTKKAKLPEVDIDIDTKSGQMPAFEVDWADVDVGTRTETITVPKVVVVMEEVEVEIPYVDVDLPNESDKRELTIQVEAEVSEKMHKIEIQEVYATGKKLYVISKLESTGQNLGDNKKVHISDRLILNAPDLDVKHYVIGKQPAGRFNNQYDYIASKSAIAGKLKKGKAIYKK